MVACLTLRLCGSTVHTWFTLWSHFGHSWVALCSQLWCFWVGYKFIKCGFSCGSDSSTFLYSAHVCRLSSRLQCTCTIRVTKFLLTLHAAHQLISDRVWQVSGSWKYWHVLGLGTRAMLKFQSIIILHERILIYSRFKQCEIWQAHSATTAPTQCPCNLDTMATRVTIRPLSCSVLRLLCCLGLIVSRLTMSQNSLKSHKSH